MKRIALVVLAALMSFSVLFTMTACLPNNEQIIRDALTTELDKLKDPNSEMWSELTDNGASDSDAMGIDPLELAKAWAKDFEYEIGEIKVEDKKATAEVTIRCKQFYPAATNATSVLLEDESLADLSSDELQKKVGKTILDELNKSSVKATTVVTSFTLIGNVWTEDASSANEYAKAFLGEQ